MEEILGGEISVHAFSGETRLEKSLILAYIST